MVVAFWIGVFAVSLALLVKGCDWLLEEAEKIGLAMGLSPFVVGVTIVGAGTSFPELISSLVAALQGLPEVAAANVIGSNVANILLIVGVSAVVARRLVVTKSLIDLDIPLLAISTVLLLGVVWDRSVTTIEALLLLLAYIFYLAYTALHEEQEDGLHYVVLPSRIDRRKHAVRPGERVAERPTLAVADFVWLIIGLVALVYGAKYLIDSVIVLSSLLGISAGIISITAVAVGTSLPELLVSVKAALQKKSDIALGNIFGSNVFNSLVVVGLPGLFRQLTVDDATFAIGVPTLIVATVLFIISGISRRIYIWEGALYIVVYVLFVGKLFNLF